jgi:hypothetical protein
VAGVAAHLLELERTEMGPTTDRADPWLPAAARRVPAWHAGVSPGAPASLGEV